MWFGRESHRIAVRVRMRFFAVQFEPVHLLWAQIAPQGNNKYRRVLKVLVLALALKKTGIGALLLETHMHFYRIFAKEQCESSYSLALKLSYFSDKTTSYNYIFSLSCCAREGTSVYALCSVNILISLRLTHTPVKC